MNPTDQPSSAPETKPAESAAAPQGLPPPEVSAIEKELEEVRAESSANLDKFVRAKAETDNIRRRAEQDVANAHKYGVERFAGEVAAVRESSGLRYWTPGARSSTPTAIRRSAWSNRARSPRTMY
jgi:molecular chaperone GrpE